MKKINFISFAILYIAAITVSFTISCGSDAKSEEQIKFEQDSIAKAQADSTANADLEAKMLQASEDSARAAEAKASH